MPTDFFKTTMKIPVLCFAAGGPADVSHLQERVDFAERVLSQQKQGGHMAGGS